MATFTGDLLDYLGSAADFQSWALDVHTALLAAGFEQTADAGQVDLAAAALPAGGAYAGFRMYRMNDTQQATAPIFLKVEYGQSSSSTRPAIRIQFGTGSNGSGTLTDPATAQVLNPGTVGTQGVARPIYACTIDGVSVVMFNLDPAVTNRIYGFMVERWRDANGAVNDDGWSYITVAATSIVEQTFKVGATWRVTRSTFCCAPPVWNSGVEGVDVGVFPHIPMWNMVKPPGLGLVMYIATDIATGTIFPVERYGVVRNYRALGHGGSTWAPSNMPNGGTPAPAMLWV